MRPVQKLLLLLVAGLFLAGACTHSPEPARAPAQPGSSAPAPPVAVDVPALVTLSIDQLSERLGPRGPVPVGFTDPILAPLQLRQVQLDSVGFFEYRGLSMVVNYDHHTRQVSSLLLLGADEQTLMHRANLVLNAPDYLVLPVFEARRLTQLLGLRVLATRPELP